MKAKHFNLICKAFLSLVFVFLPISNSAQQILKEKIFLHLSDGEEQVRIPFTIIWLSAMIMAESLQTARIT